MELYKKSLAAKIHKIKKVVRPLLAIMRRKKRQSPEGAESTPRRNPNNRSFPAPQLYCEVPQQYVDAPHQYADVPQEYIDVPQYMEEADTVPPVWQVNFRTEVDDNSANEALEARLKDFILSTPYPGCRLQVEGTLVITPIHPPEYTAESHYPQHLHDFEEPYIPVQFDRSWENYMNHSIDSGSMYFRDFDAVTAHQQAEMQVPYALNY